MFLDVLPSINASCNAISAIFIVLGAIAIKRRHIEAHKKYMLIAFAFSVLFLIGYLTRYALAGTTRFQGEGTWRTIYFSILFSHMALAIVNLPLIVCSVYLGLKNRIDRHKSLVRFTLPIWLYVSVTGVIIYFMLYHCFA